MPDLEERVATLEREMSVVKERVSLNEGDLKSIPDLIKLEFRLAASQRARLARDVEDLKEGMADTQAEISRLRDLPAKVEALPRIVAELVSEMLVERDRKR